jgi:hypothetical protein
VKLFVAIAVAAGAALTGWGWQVVHRPLAPRCERELRRISDYVHVGSARLAGLGVDLFDVRMGPLHARRAHVTLDRHVLLSGVEVRQFAAAEVALDFTGTRLRRAAFSGGRLGRLGDLAGVVVREADHFSVRVARPGLSLSGRVGASVDARLELERLPLDGLLPDGLDGSRARASGLVELRKEGARWTAAGRVSVDDLAVEHRAVAAGRVEHLSPTVEGAVAYQAGRFVSDRLELRQGPLAVRLRGQLGDDFDVHADVLPLDCSAALTVLRPLVPILDGMVLEGRLGGTVEARGARRSVDDLRFDLDVGCRVKADAPLADLSDIDVPVAVSVASLPPPVLRAFVAAEDGKFFRHHGFDPDMIRHALSHDLGAGRIEKGASTITQQLVKNLYLSGERTLARKLEEAVLAWRAEQLLDKQRILELYLNVVELAPGTRGLADGADRYFGKEADQLTADEAAQLAALLPAPRRGMDAAWEKRYGALAARLPFEHVPMNLTRR